MERTLGVKGMLRFALPLTLVAIAFTAVVVAYGMESVAPGVHDAFHDFRHVIGMPCH